MVPNVLKIALRVLLRQPLFSMINIVGLGVGLACSAFIFAYVQYELGFEDFNERADQVYRLTKDQGAAGYPPPLTGLLKQIPGVEQVAMNRPCGRPLLSHGDVRDFHEVLGADEHFFDLLGLPLIRGDHRGLARPYTFVISERIAQQFFPDQDPIGKVLRWDALFDLEVVGVFRLPSNTHLSHDIVVSLATWEVETSYGTISLQNWHEWRPHGFYVMMEPAATTESFSQNLLAAARVDGPDWLPDRLQERGQLPFLRAIGDIHLNEEASAGHVYLLGTIGALVLFIACVNFINLSTACSAQRVREVGVRKALGAQQRQLARQFLLESALQVLAAALLAVGLIWLCRPAYTALTGLEAHILRDGLSLLWLGVGLLIVTLLGAGYPAIVLSRLQPMGVLRDAVRSGVIGSMLRRRLLEFQFALAILLSLGTGVVHRQLQYMSDTDLGFDRTHVLSFKTGYRGLRRQSEAIANAMEAIPGVRGVGAQDNPPFFEPFNRANDLEIRVNEGAEPQRVKQLAINSSFAETMGLDLIAGRSTRAHLPLDALEVLVNETAVVTLGFDSARQAVGATLQDWGRGTPTIVGVVGDFHYQTLHRSIEPLLMWSPGYDSRNWTDGGPIESYGNIIVRVDAKALPTVLDELAATWRTFAPEFPFHYEFIEDVFEAKHRQERTLSRLLNWFAGLALLLTGTGVFAMAAYNASQRTKEIGMRKILGASQGRIMLTVLRDFTPALIIAAVVALPLGLWAATGWLADFPYHIEADALTAAGAVLSVLAMAMLATIQQILRATRLQPVDALRHE